MWAVPFLCELYPGIWLTTEEKARKNLSQGSRRVPAGMMKTEYTEQSIHNNKTAYITISGTTNHITKPHNLTTQSSDTPLCESQIPQIFFPLFI